MAQTLDYMVNLVEAGVDLFDVDLGCYDNWWLPHPPNFMPAGCFLEVARIAREYLRERGNTSNAGLEVPVVAVGKLGNPDLGEKALREGPATWSCWPGRCWPTPNGRTRRTRAGARSGRASVIRKAA